ncbi:hypothetical protein KSP40_PGU021681 [Platanthera guangdongensis]|uniref:Uncharacterized protein n=1 Tax=Platanthera guangdongensis TaxID=2320717 RepID=A0ABR2MWT1_9ASPA
MQKEIYISDISDQQNRLLIRSQVVAERIMPMMTGEEIEAANLTADTKKRRRLYNDGGEAGERKQGQEHGGLEVMVYNRDGWGCWLSLTRGDASKASVLKGGNYREFRHRSFFTAGDTVEMWAFRGEDGRLFLAIGNQINLEISLRWDFILKRLSFFL